MKNSDNTCVRLYGKQGCRMSNLTDKHRCVVFEKCLSRMVEKFSSYILIWKSSNVYEFSNTYLLINNHEKY